MSKLADDLRKIMKEITDWGNKPVSPILLPRSLYERAEKLGIDMSDYAIQQYCDYDYERIAKTIHEAERLCGLVSYHVSWEGLDERKRRSYIQLAKNLEELLPCPHEWEVLPDEWQTKRCIHCGEKK